MTVNFHHVSAIYICGHLYLRVNYSPVCSLLLQYYPVRKFLHLYDVSYDLHTVNLYTVYA